MRKPLSEQCDHYIKKCKNILKEKDIKGARQLSAEATAVFASIVPGWYGGLMASITQFYLDDIEMILGKLTIFKSTLSSDNFAAVPHSASSAYRNLAGVADQIMTLDEHVAQVIRWLEKVPSIDETEKAEIINQIKIIQNTAETVHHQQVKWNKMKPLLIWVSTKDVHVASRIIPLIIQAIR